MVVIRLARGGRNKYPVYRLVAADSRRAATGKFIAILGQYNPHTKEVVLDREAIGRYLANGAQPSNTVTKLLMQGKVELPEWVRLATRSRAPKKAAPEAPAEPASESETAEVTPAEAEAEAAETEAVGAPIETEATEESSPEAPTEERVAEVATETAADTTELAQPLDHTETAADDVAAADRAEVTEEAAIEEAEIPAEADSAV